MTGNAALSRYAANATALAARYDAVTTDTLLDGLLDLLSSPPAPVLDIVAGSGRDSAWFAERGYDVTAAEPVAAYRTMISARAPRAAIHSAEPSDLKATAGSFALILVNAVWHHLAPPALSRALVRMAGLLAPEGRVLLSLRQSPVFPGQPLYTLEPDEEAARGAQAGLRLLRGQAAPSFEAHATADGITWFWLLLQKDRSQCPTS